MSDNPSRIEHIEAARHLYERLKGATGRSCEIVSAIRHHLNAANLDAAVLDTSGKRTAENLDEELKAYESHEGLKRPTTAPKYRRDIVTERLASIGSQILDIAAGRAEIRTTTSYQPGGIVATKTDVRCTSVDSKDPESSKAR